MSKVTIKELDQLSPALKRKAKHLVGLIRQNPAKTYLWGGKKLRGKYRLIQFRLNRKYRMVVQIGKLLNGPYLCMKHSTFDRLYGK